MGWLGSFWTHLRAHGMYFSSFAITATNGVKVRVRVREREIERGGRVVLSSVLLPFPSVLSPKNSGRTAIRNYNYTKHMCTSIASMLSIIVMITIIVIDDSLVMIIIFSPHTGTHMFGRNNSFEPLPVTIPSS